MQIYWHIIENIQMESNKVDNFEALYCTMALLCVETGGEDIIVELFRLAIEIQVSFYMNLLAFLEKSLKVNF